jgi:hypothetical protein
MRPSRSSPKPNQAPKANNRAAKKRKALKIANGGLHIIQRRGVPASVGSKSANRRRKQG